MIRLFSLTAACTALAAAVCSAQLPDVLRPVPAAVETKHVCCRAAHVHSIAVSALDGRPSAVQRRNYDVLSYDLFMDWRGPLQAVDVTELAREFSGVNRIRLRIDSAHVSTLRLNAERLRIDSVHTTPQRVVQIAQPDNGEWSITVDEAFNLGDTVQVEVYYTSRSTDNRGFHLYPKGQVIGPLPNGEMAIVEEQLAYTMSEPEDARRWMPCNDLPYDKALTSIAVRVPEPFTVASNGLLEQVRDEGDGSRTFFWKSSSPMPTYLMVAVSSVYREFSEWYHRRDNSGDSIPVLYYVWQKDYDATAIDESEYNARHAFRNTVRMMEAFSDRLVEYPFEKYGMAALQPFDFGGMEHQTLSTINRRWMRVFDDPGIAHELMHQWTGDLVTCASFADIWLNEGGATFGEALWAEEDQGAGGYMQTMMEKRAAYLGTGGNETPIYAPSYIFNYATTYAKAGWVYHMLRRMLGDEVFFTALKAYFAEFADRSIETEHMVAFFERQVPNPPVPFRTFFDQWIYGARHPIYRVAFHSAAMQGGAYPLTVRIEQTQTGADVPDVFAMPLSLTLLGPSGERTVMTVLNTERLQEFDTVTTHPVQAVVVNEEHDILAEVEQVVAGVAEADAESPLMLPTPNPVVRGGELALTVAVRRFGPVTVVMLDATGRTVGTLYTGTLVPGTYRIADRVPDVAPGAYFLRIAKDDTVKMVQLVVSE